MAFDLTIEIGGLCLLVQQTDSDARGLYVLMAELTGPHHHVPLLVYDGAYIGQPTEHVEQLWGTEVDVTGVIADGAPTPFPPEMAPISYYAECFIGDGTPKPVKKRFTTGNIPRGILAARVRLDLGHILVPSSKQAGMEVVDDAGAVIDRRYMVGIVRTETTRVPADSLEVRGRTLEPKDGEMRLRFYNALHGDYNAGDRPHPRHEYQEHFKGHFPLLGMNRGPRLRTAEDYYPFATLSASTAVVGIDPVQCTVGGGCSESNPQC